jgi:hypothetical protein
MSEPQPPLSKTPARGEALQDVVMGLVSYNPLLGVYLKSGKAVSGPKRRTLAELRERGFIDRSDPRKVAKMVLTDPLGENLAIEWGLKNPAAAETAE